MRREGDQARRISRVICEFLNRKEQGILEPADIKASSLTMHSIFLVVASPAQRLPLLKESFLPFSTTSTHQRQDHRMTPKERQV